MGWREQSEWNGIVEYDVRFFLPYYFTLFYPFCWEKGLTYKTTTIIISLTLLSSPLLYILLLLGPGGVHYHFSLTELDETELN